MKQIYKQIWKLAKPYYKKGRPMDIDHIEWMIKNAILICKKEGLDDTLLIPLVILHDVGYSRIKDIKNANYYKLDLRKKHMKMGKKITIDILKKVSYPHEKINKIAYYVSIHDNWAYGEVNLYNNDKILGTFKDLDYIWVFTLKGFSVIKKMLGKTNKEMLEYLKAEPSPIGGKKPFSNQVTKKLHDKYLTDRENEIFKK